MPRRKPRARHLEPDFDPIQTIVERIMDHPQTQKVLDQASAYFDDFGIIIDRAARRGVEATTRGDPRAEARYRRLVEELKRSEARRQAQAKAVPEETPRQILGFGPAEPLTKDLVKKRHRAYAAIVHPDKGGNTEIMQRYNVAAAALLKELKAC